MLLSRTFFSFTDFLKSRVNLELIVGCLTVIDKYFMHIQDENKLYTLYNKRQKIPKGREITNEQSKEIGNIGNKTKKNKAKTQIT